MLRYYDITRRRFLRIAGLTTLETMLASAAIRTATAGEAAQPSTPIPSMRADEALAMALIDADVALVTSVPATATAQIFDAYNRLSGQNQPFSFNEEVAYSLSHGCALSGRRAAAVIKAHGLAKAANSLIDSLTAGTTAGLVVIVTHDKTGGHSDNIFDLSALLKGTGIPFRMPDKGAFYQDLLSCFLWSEQLGLPVAVFVDSDDLVASVELARTRLPAPTRRYSREPLFHVLCPPLAGYQHRVLQARLAGQPPPPTADAPRLSIPDGLPPKWQAAVQPYLPLFAAFRQVREEEGIDWVSGDTGLGTLFAFSPFDCVDVCTYYGGSLPLALGAQLGGRRAVWAVSGDYAFIAAGHLGLVEAVARERPLKILLLHNGCALATGGQPIPPKLLDHLLAGYRERVRVLRNPQDSEAARSILTQAARSPGLEIILAEYV